VTENGCWGIFFGSGAKSGRANEGKRLVVCFARIGEISSCGSAVWVDHVLLSDWRGWRDLVPCTELCYCYCCCKCWGVLEYVSDDVVVCNCAPLSHIRCWFFSVLPCLVNPYFPFKANHIRHLYLLLHTLF
jgi:hypothetical protein